MTYVKHGQHKQIEIFLICQGITTDIVDNFQSAYKTGHSCETALLRVYNDIVTTIVRGNGAMLVLLDLSAAIPLIMIICFAS